MSEPTGKEFWAAQRFVSLSPAARGAIYDRKEALFQRKRELGLRCDELEANGGTDEEWEAYRRAIVTWNNDVMDLAEDTGVDISPALYTALGHLIVPLEGSRRTGGRVE